MCQKPLTKCLSEIQKEPLNTLHFTNTLIHSGPLNGCPQTCFPLNYFQPTPAMTDKMAQQAQAAAFLQNPVTTTVSLVWLIASTQIFKKFLVSGVYFIDHISKLLFLFNTSGVNLPDLAKYQ